MSGASNQFAVGARRGGSQSADMALDVSSQTSAGPAGIAGPAAFSRVVALPILACEGCGDALVMGAACRQCERRAALLRRLAARHERRENSQIGWAARRSEAARGG